MGSISVSLLVYLRFWDFQYGSFFIHSGLRISWCRDSKEIFVVEPQKKMRQGKLEYCFSQEVITKKWVLRWAAITVKSMASHCLLHTWCFLGFRTFLETSDLLHIVKLHRFNNTVYTVIQFSEDMFKHSNYESSSRCELQCDSHDNWAYTSSNNGILGSLSSRPQSKSFQFALSPLLCSAENPVNH